VVERKKRRFLQKNATLLKRTLAEHTQVFKLFVGDFEVFATQGRNVAPLG